MQNRKTGDKTMRNMLNEKRTSLLRNEIIRIIAKLFERHQVQKARSSRFKSPDNLTVLQELSLTVTFSTSSTQGILGELS